MPELIRVLIVEDNQISRKILVEGLKQYAFEIIEAENAQQGIEYALNYEPDLILLDLNLPDYSGFKVLEEIRKNPKTMLIPVIVITVSATSDDVQKAILYGVKNYVVKPVNIEDLVRRITKVLNLPLEELKKAKGSNLVILYPGIDESKLNITEYLGKRVKKVDISQLEIGMKVGVPLAKDPLGKEILYKPGVPLNEKRIEKIIEAGFEWIYIIDEPSELEEGETL